MGQLIVSWSHHTFYTLHTKNFIKIDRCDLIDIFLHYQVIGVCTSHFNVLYAALLFVESHILTYICGHTPASVHSNAYRYCIFSINLLKLHMNLTLFELISSVTRSSVKKVRLMSIKNATRVRIFNHLTFLGTNLRWLSFWA